MTVLDYFEAVCHNEGFESYEQLSLSLRIHQ